MQLNYSQIKRIADHITSMGEKLRPYQVDAMKFCRDIDNPYLAADCGLGKTLIATTLIAGYQVKTIVIAPKNVALMSWPEELDLWAPWLTYSVVKGDPKARTKALAKDADIHIVSFSNLVWMVKNIKWKWDLVILDEISFMKSHASERYKAFRAVRKYCKKVIGMSATPAANKIDALYSQYYCLDQGATLGEKITHFRNRYMMRVGNDYNQWTPRPGAAEEIRALVKPTMLRLRSVDHLKELPQVQPCYHYFELDNWDDYREMMKNSVLTDEGIIAGTAAVRSTKLRQIVSGFIYDKQSNTHYLNADKTKVFENLMRELEGEQVLIFYQFQEEQRFIGAPGIEVKDAWNRGEARVMCCHPDSAGHGLNLQHSGAHHIIWFSQPWSLEHLLQGLGRLTRSGNKAKTIFSHVILAKKTIEIRIKNVLQRRMSEHLKLME
jgi:SNF2 family DNA or RNA helicase